MLDEAPIIASSSDSTLFAIGWVEFVSICDVVDVDKSFSIDVIMGLWLVDDGGAFCGAWGGDGDFFERFSNVLTKILWENLSKIRIKKCMKNKKIHENYEFLCNFFKNYWKLMKITKTHIKK